MAKKIDTSKPRKATMAGRSRASSVAPSAEMRRLEGVSKIPGAERQAAAVRGLIERAR